MVDIQFYTLLKQIMGKFYIMRGNPKDEFNNEELEKSWDKIPSTIRNFYRTVHNGFYFYASQSMGLVPLENVTF